MSNKENPLVRRCPRLGSSVHFGYCKKSGDGGSCCFKIFDCWWETFDVVQYLKDSLSPEEFKRLEDLQDSGPKSKVGSLVNAVNSVTEKQK